MANVLYLYGGESALSLQLMGSGTVTGPNILAGAGNGYAPGAYAPDVQSNGSIFRDGARPIYARSGNVVDSFLVNVKGTSVANALDIVEQIQAVLDEARDFGVNLRHRQLPRIAITLDGSANSNYSAIFGGAVELPDVLFDAQLANEFTIPNVVLTVEREPFWRAYDPAKSATPGLTAFITPPVNLNYGNYNSPFGTITVAQSTSRRGCLGDLRFSPIVNPSPTVTVGNLIVGGRSTYRNRTNGNDNSVWPGGIIEAESGSFGTDTAVAADATASPGGGGNTKARVTFATVTSNVVRVTVNTPATGGGKYYYLSGAYRVFVRAKLSGASTVTMNVATVRLTGTTEVAGAAVSFTATSWTIVDLGLIYADTAQDRVQLEGTGYTNDAIKIYAARTGAATNLDIDAIILVPVDEYYGSWTLAGSTWTSNANILRSSNVEPYGNPEFVALELSTAAGGDTPTGTVGLPGGVGTGEFSFPYGTTTLVYVLGDSSWVAPYEVAGLYLGVRFNVQGVPIFSGPRG